MKLYPRPPASQMARVNSQYARTPAQKVSSGRPLVLPRPGAVEKLMLPDVVVVRGNALTMTDVMIP